MSKWSDFEGQCVDYLNKTFGKQAIFTLLGGADSTKPDVYVKTNSGKTFFIEIKSDPAQCGQFVLLPTFPERVFKFSEGNKSVVDDSTKIIIDYMNSNFDYYCTPSTQGAQIIIPDGEHIFTNWVKSYYEKKGVDFFITKSFVIFPISELSSYFHIEAKYRIKKWFKRRS